MKKTLFLLVFGCIGYLASAQYYIGVKAGGGMAIRSGTATFATSPGAAITGGIAYKHQIFNRMILEGDILMDMRMPTLVSPDSGDFSSMYITVPITAQWIMPLHGKELQPYRVNSTSNYWYVEGGPHFKYGLAVSGYDPEAGAENPNNIDVGITAGVGTNFGFSNSMSRFSAGARFNYGFLNTYQSYTGGPVMTNMSAIAFVGLDFSLTKRKYIKHRW